LISELPRESAQNMHRRTRPEGLSRARYRRVAGAMIGRRGGQPWRERDASRSRSSSPDRTRSRRRPGHPSSDRRLEHRVRRSQACAVKGLGRPRRCREPAGRRRHGRSSVRRGREASWPDADASRQHEGACLHRRAATRPAVRPDRRLHRRRSADRAALLGSALGGAELGRIGDRCHVSPGALSHRPVLRASARRDSASCFRA
jgi:hypothetical protein